MSFRAINNSLFQVINRSSVTQITPLNIGLTRNFFIQAWIDTGFLAYLDSIRNWTNQSSDSFTSPTVSRTLTTAENGNILLIPNLTAAITLTLPAVIPGLTYTFIINASPTNGFGCTVQSTSANLFGPQYAAGGVGLGIVGATRFVFSGNVANTKVGDRVSVFCDGTNWHVKAQAQVLAGVSFS